MEKLIHYKAQWEFLIFIISLVIYVLIAVFISMQRNAFWYRYVLAFLPVIISFVVFLLRRRFDKPKLFLAVKILLIAFSFVYLCWQSLSCIFVDEQSEVSDYTRYQHVMQLDGAEHDVSLAHFPKVIPQKAMNIYFYDYLSFFGESYIYLRYDTDDTEKNALHERFKGLSKHETGRWTDSPISNNEEIPFPELNGIGIINIENYDIFIVDYGVDYSYGFMLNREGPDVIYWSESW